MNRKLLIVLYTVFIVAYVDGESESDKIDVDKLFPYQVSIRSNGSHIAGGSIINYRYILTSAEWLYRYEGSLVSLSVSVGMHDRFKPEITYRVKKARIHENFTTHTMQNDIALIKTDRKIQFNDRVKAVSLPTRDAQVNEEVVLTGWGKSEDSENAPSELQWTDLIIRDNDVCVDVYGSDIITSANICATDREGKGTCRSDFGAPLVYDASNTLFGIASQIQHCKSGKPDVFTRVYHFLQWIQENQQ